MYLFSSRALSLSVCPPPITVGFGPSEQLLGPWFFAFAMKVEKAAVGGAKNSGGEQDKCVMIRPKGEEEGKS
jgi:hypothetical protein